MQHDIPQVVEELYAYLVVPPDPDLWPERLRADPVRGHGLWSFYQGLRLGIQLAAGTLETL